MGILLLHGSYTPTPFLRTHRLGDLENTFLDLSPSSLGNFANLAHHSPEVMGFAEVMYEMVTGRVLEGAHLPNREGFLASLIPEWRKVFEVLFPVNTEVESGVTLGALRKMPPFSTTTFSVKFPDIPWNRESVGLLRELTHSSDSGPV